MYILGLLRYMKGYLTIRVEGLYIERFINMSVAHGINLWDIRRLNLTAIELKLSIRDYKSLKKVTNMTKCQVYIIGKEGFPFSILKFKKRKMLAIGFVISILFVFMLSSFIWSIKILGANSISSKEIEKNLYELGVKPGAFKLNLAVADIENNMLIKMNSISWIKVKLNGTQAEIEIKERIEPPSIVSVEKPCDIIAKRDGIIVKIVSDKGDTRVNPGDPVKKGQILVSGMIERPNIETRYVHSSGIVKARTWYEEKVTVPFETTEKVRTGNKKTKILLKTPSKQFVIKNCDIPYENYDKIEKSAKLINSDKFQFPVEIMIEEYYQTVNKTTIITPEQAKTDAINKAEKNIIDNMPLDAKIINKKINATLKDNIAIASALIETYEDIGTQVEIK